MKTPQQSYPALAKALGVPMLFLKREDMHPYGSHKGRSIPHMIKTYLKRDNKRHFVISSSGNAAIAAVRTVKKHNQNNPETSIQLTVFVGENIDHKKLERLKEEVAHTTDSITLLQVDRPKQQAFTMAQNTDTVSLRQSTDDLALEGYAELANELLKIEDLKAIFVPTSSGTTAEAIATGCLKTDPPPQVHIIQTTMCSPIATALGASAEPTKTSKAGAIVDIVAHRKQAVVDAISKTQGSGWIATDDDISEAMHLVKETTGLQISPNSALSIVGLMQARKRKQNFYGPVVCLICGD